MNLAHQIVDYDCNGTALRGYASWNQDAEGELPLVLVIHEWWGVNDYIKSRVDSLASEGYAAMALDMYGEGQIAENPEQANTMMMSVLNDMDSGTARLRAGFDAGCNLEVVDNNRVAAIGYCFGGAMALHMARIGMPLKASVSFHGALGSFHQPGPGEVRSSILVCHGEADAMVSMDDVAAFKTEMDAANADYVVNVYPDAPHGFTSREADRNGEKYGIPVGYQEQADVASWDAMMHLFGRTLS